MEKASRADTDPPRFERSITSRFERFTWHSETTGNVFRQISTRKQAGHAVSTQSHKETTFIRHHKSISVALNTVQMTFRHHSPARLEDSITIPKLNFIPHLQVSCLHEIQIVFCFFADCPSYFYPHIENGQFCFSKLTK